jgi:hypothetical protein
MPFQGRAIGRTDVDASGSAKFGLRTGEAVGMGTGKAVIPFTASAKTTTTQIIIFGPGVLTMTVTDKVIIQLG